MNRLPAVPATARAALVRAAQTPGGQTALAAVAALLLAAGFGKLGFLISLILFAANVNPKWRRVGFTVTAAVVCAISVAPATRGGISSFSDRGALLVLAATAAFTAAMWAWTRHWERLPGWLARRPLTLLHGGAVVGMGLLWSMSRSGWVSATGAALATWLLPELLWRASYWAKWRVRQSGPVRAAENLFVLIPFAGHGAVPYGKGPDYLGRFEARNATELAAVRLRAVWLLALAVVWKALASILVGALHGAESLLVRGFLDIPVPVTATPLVPSMAALVEGPWLFSLAERWAAIFAELAQAILRLAAYGHTMVAVYCLAGFAIPRNTNAPLFATSILDFWARYYYYFKELLMDFFFFPVYLRARALPPLARTLLATAAAAFAGNVYYHLLLYAPDLMSGNAGEFGRQAAARVAYCALLGTGLCVSFALALRRRPGEPVSRKRKALGATAALVFFALIHVWNFTGAGITADQRAAVWGALFGGY